LLSQAPASPRRLLKRMFFLSTEKLGMYILNPQTIPVFFEPFDISITGNSLSWINNKEKMSQEAKQTKV
jgi:hypothetical protein